MITKTQLRMAQAGLGLTNQELGVLCHCSHATIVNAKSDGLEVLPRTLLGIQQALEDHGVDFLPDNGIRIWPESEEDADSDDIPSNPTQTTPKQKTAENGLYKPSGDWRQLDDKEMIRPGDLVWKQDTGEWIPAMLGHIGLCGEDVACAIKPRP
jgi:hypothetical protein